MSMFKRAYFKLKDMYHRQPQVIVIQPLRNSEEDPKPFSMKGVILAKWKKPRTLSFGGTSHHFNVPEEWVPTLGQGPFELRLFQTDVKGVIISEVGGDYREC